MSSCHFRDSHCYYSPKSEPVRKKLVLPKAFKGRAIAEAFVRIGTFFDETNSQESEVKKWIGELIEYHDGYRTNETGELEYVLSVGAWTGRHGKCTHQESGWYFNDSHNAAFILERLSADQMHDVVEVRVSSLTYEKDWRSGALSKGLYGTDRKLLAKLLKDLVRELAAPRDILLVATP